jgi:nuclear pore complex protein Nup62
MTYRQLEDSINKWTLELEEQEGIFLDQATQVNAWDRLLIDNADKITQVNSDVERVKLDQQRLDHELDFILAQQRELEDLLLPLEQSVAQLPPVSYQQHADLEREHTYKLAETVDSQLKQMSSDLRQIVEHINASNSKQDSADPLVLIAKILNAHVDSLDWIDQNTGLLQKKVEEVARQATTQRAHQENNFRRAF